MLWNPEVYASEYDRQYLNRRLIQQGGSFTALELFCLMRVLDYFEKDDRVDKERVGVIGLSYGGMYALHFGATDTRIKSTVSSCWFNDRSIHAWHDWTYFGAEKTFFDTEVASLVLPRKLYIEIGKNDPTFRSNEAEWERQRLFAYAKAQGVEDKLAFVVFEGEHELDKDNATISAFLQDLQ
jgi:predicted alpha/beta superfamily hydrolase